MTDLSGRELDAAIARLLGLAECPDTWLHYRPNGAKLCVMLPEFHRSIDAIVEHCGPWLRESGIRVARVEQFLFAELGRNAWARVFLHPRNVQELARAIYAAGMAEQEAQR